MDLICSPILKRSVSVYIYKVTHITHPKLYKQGLSKPPLNIKVSTFIENQNVVNAEHSQNHSAVVYSIPAPSWLFVMKVLGVLCSIFVAFVVYSLGLLNLQGQFWKTSITVVQP